MRTKTALKALALVTAAVVLGLLSVQGSYALWNRMVSANAGTIQAADFRVLLTDMKSGTAYVNSASVQLTPFSGGLLPGTSVYAGVKISNFTNAGSDFTVRADSGQAVIANPEFLGHLTVKSRASATEPCPMGGYTSETAFVDQIAKDASAFLCFEISLLNTAPSTVSAKTTDISIPISVKQNQF